MNNVDKQYLELLEYILKNGTKKSDRTGTGTVSIFDYTMRFNMDEGFPLLTSKKMYTKGIIHELIWFLRGDTNIKYLVENGVHIWDGDAYKNYSKKVAISSNPYDRHILSSEPMELNGDKIEGWGGFKIGNDFTKEEFIEKIKTDESFAKRWGDLGPVYGSQWRNVEKVTHTAGLVINVKYFDQIHNLIKDLKENPDSRRLMVSAWNVAEIDNMVLPPCHYGFQCYTQEMELDERISRWCESLNKHISYGEDMTHDKLDSIEFPKRKLSLKWTQRSVDVFLGLGFNITSYAILLHLLCKEVNMIPNDLIFSGGDCHIYLNHIQQAKEQIKRETFGLPKLVLRNSSIDDLKFEDIEIVGYKSSGVLKGELSN